MITSIERMPDCLIVHTKEGVLRFQPYLSSSVRITYSKRNEFSQRPGRIVLHEFGEAPGYELKETDSEVVFCTESIQIRVDRQNCALSYYNSDGNLLTREPKRGGRILEEIDVFRMEYDPLSEVETVNGIDGIKATVRGARKVKDRKAYHARLEFEFGKGEALYGLGSHEEGMMNLRGQHQYLYQENMKAVVPVMLSTKGYGILLDCQSLMTFHDDAFGSYFWCDVVEELDYHFIYGPCFDEIISNYRKLTGTMPMLPKWAFGYMQSKERYRTQEELLEIAAEYRRRRIPIDTIILDWQSWPGELWGQKTLDTERFPDPDTMMEQLHAMNTRLMISIWPNMSAGGDNHSEFIEKGLMLGNRTHYDPFRKEGRELYWKQAKEGLFKYGIDAWWCDCSEPFEADWRGTVKPEPEERMLINTDEAKKYIDPGDINAYSLLHSKGIYEGQRSITDKKRVVNLTRSSYAGQHRYSTITWSGDTSANWETLRRQIPAGLNFTVTGEPYWTMDIGAFFINGRDKQKMKGIHPSIEIPWFMSGDYDDGCDDLGYRELYVRWFQFGAFVPIFRSHGTGTPREVWRFGEKNEIFYDTLVKFVNLRYRLLPYIYSLAGMVTHHGYTMMRALAFDFQEDAMVYQIDDQYMFGPAFMVCPVTEPMYYTSGSVELKNIPKTRNVYFPKGCDWYDSWTGKRFKAGETACVDATLDIMPLFVREGSIVPIGPVIQYADESTNEPLELVIYSGSDGEFMYYEDAGDGYEYEKGEYSFTRIIWKDDISEISIEPAGGNLTLSKKFKITVVCGGVKEASNIVEPASYIQYDGIKIIRRI